MTTKNKLDVNATVSITTQDGTELTMTLHEAEELYNALGDLLIGDSNPIDELVDDIVTDMGCGNYFSMKTNVS